MKRNQNQKALTETNPKEQVHWSGGELTRMIAEL